MCEETLGMSFFIVLAKWGKNSPPGGLGKIVKIRTPLTLVNGDKVCFAYFYHSRSNDAGSPTIGCPLSGCSPIPQQLSAAPVNF